MRKRTTTQKLQEAITDNLLHIIKVEIYYMTSRETETIDADKFYENFSFLCESGIFSDAIGWHYERDYRTGDYIIETGRMDGNSENIIIAHLSVCDDANIEDIERILKIVEE